MIMENEFQEIVENIEPVQSRISEKRVYTLSEVTEILRVSKPTALKLVKEGNFAAFQIGSSSAWRISKKSFDAWLDGQTEGVNV